jgi:hypothetical protein
MTYRLGLIYLTGSGKKDQRDNQPRTITLGFWDADSTGAPYKFVKIQLHTDMPIDGTHC